MSVGVNTMNNHGKEDEGEPDKRSETNYALFQPSSELWLENNRRNAGAFHRSDFHSQTHPRVTAGKSNHSSHE